VTAGLPRPVPLPDPPGSPAALDAVVEQLTTAAFAAGLTVHLLERTAVLSGWHGADAAAAVAAGGAVTAVATDLHESLTAARARLADHHELWMAVLARVAGLRDDQRAQFADAGARLALLSGVAVETGLPAAPPAAAQALVRRVADDDAARGAEHRAVLQALAEDAAAAAGVLTAASRPFGGTGRVGDAPLVTAHLAAQLPEWGAGALATLGSQAADELTRPGTAAQLATAASDWLPYVELPDFAEALVGRLGSHGVGWLLSVLGGLATTGQEQPLAALLAGALGGSGSEPGRRVEDVLAGLRLDPDAPDGAVDGIATGMAAVLAAPGATAGLATAWGGQALAREAARGVRAGAAATGEALLPDPVDAALAVLARTGDRMGSAVLLGEPGAWRALLSRQWPGGADDLTAVIGLAASAATAGRAARSALIALGEGLGPGSGGRVLPEELALAAVRPAVTGLVSGRTDVVLPILDAAAGGPELDRATDAALRGLGRLVAEGRSAAGVTAAIGVALRSGRAGESAAAVAGAHVAVLEYGQRLQYALTWSRAQSSAVDAQMVWTFGVSLPIALWRGPVGAVAGGLEGLVADALDANGEVELAPDDGVVRTREDAARFAVQTMGPDGGRSTGPAASAAFDRTGAVLRRLEAPAESLLDRFDDLPLPDPSRWSAPGG
jgi:hypothetical protein